MTDAELFALVASFTERAPPVPVRVTANDYAYDGWIVGASVKRSGAIRAVIEDSNGRLFIHNAGQIEERL